MAAGTRSGGYGATKLGRARGALSQARSGAGFHAKSLALLILMPFAAFSAIVLSVAFTYFSEPLITWGIALLCLTVAGMCFLLSSFNDKGPIYTVCGWLMLIATAAGLTFGLVDFALFFCNYWWAVNGGDHYNVLPSEPAVAHVDASVITFSPSSKVDLMKTIGYHDRAVYCMAPIMDSAQQDRVEYWAVGLNCCGTRSNFRCDDAADPTASSGVVLHRPASRVLPSDYDKFLIAAKEAAAAYDLIAADDPILVRWVKDPTKTIETMWVAGLGLLLTGLLVALVVFILLGSVLHMYSNKK